MRLSMCFVITMLCCGLAIGSIGCKPLPPGVHTFTLRHDTVPRTYVVYMPSGVEEKEELPVVFSLHGLGSNADEQQLLTGMNETADNADTGKFIVVYPNGAAQHADGYKWNSGAPLMGNYDDVGFIRAVIEDLAERTYIKRSMIYATGMSNGGGMAHRLGCEAADVFAAIAPVEGTKNLKGDDCNPQREIPVIIYHGNHTSIPAYNPIALDAMDEWHALNGCEDTSLPEVTYDDTELDDPDGSDSTCVTYACEEGTETTLCTLNYMEHCWPGGLCADERDGQSTMVHNDEINASQHMWEFFKQHPML